MTDNAAHSSTGSHDDQRPTGCQPAHHPAVSRPMESTRIARSDASALADLQLHWGGAYEIGLDGDIWSATFRGTIDELRAHTAVELRVLIRADYAYRQQAGPARHGGAASHRAGCDGGGSGYQPDSASGGDVVRGERMSL